jgi:gluconolactonase
MRKLWIIGFAILVSVSAGGQRPETGPVLRLDSALDEIVSPDAKLEKLAGNFGHLEGPVWVRKGGYLLFTDNIHNVINKWNPSDGKVSVFLDRADQGFTPDGVSMLGGPNGSTEDPQGRYVYTTRVDHTVVRLEKGGRRTILASQYEGKNLNGINDLVFKSNGSLYFTDPTWGNRERREKKLPEPKWELPFQGVYLLRKGKLQLLSKDFSSPNGIALSPDEKFLYVNDNSKKTIVRFEVQPDDTVTHGKVFIDMSADKEPGSPDGMKVDAKGNVYCAGPGGLWIISPEGKHLGKLLFPESAANFAFGDPDAKTLYVAGTTALYRIRLKTPGLMP